MLYVKAKLTDEVEVRVEVYCGNMFYQCFKCGKERPVDELLLHDLLEDPGSLDVVEISCATCEKVE